MKICYGSYNDRLPEGKRELFAKAFADKMRKDLEALSGDAVEITWCPEKGDLVSAINGGCDVVITEGKLRMPAGGHDGDENVGFGTVKEWKGLNGVKRVILLLPVDDKPAIAKKEDGSEIIGSGRKVVEMYRKGYYDALYVNDLKPSVLISIIKEGRGEAAAKDYYGVTDDMLALLIESENGKRKKKEKEKPEKKGMFGGLFARKESEKETEAEGPVKKEDPIKSATPAAEEAKQEIPSEKVPERKSAEPVSSNNKEEINKTVEPVIKSENKAPEVAPEKTNVGEADRTLVKEVSKEEINVTVNENKKEESAAMDREVKNGTDAEKPAKAKHEIDAETASVLRTILSGGMDALFEEEGKEEPKVTETSSAEKGASAGGFDFDFSFDAAAVQPVEKKEASPMKEVINERADRQQESVTAAVAEPVQTSTFQGTESGLRTGRVTSYLNGGTLLALELNAAPDDPDVNRYGVTVISKGSGRGRVVNGRYQSDVIAFEGFCVKLMMQRTILVEVPDESAPPAGVVNRECMVTFTQLQ